MGALRNQLCARTRLPIIGRCNRSAREFPYGILLRPIHYLSLPLSGLGTRRKTSRNASKDVMGSREAGPTVQCISTGERLDGVDCLGIDPLGWLPRAIHQTRGLSPRGRMKRDLRGTCRALFCLFPLPDSNDILRLFGLYEYGKLYFPQDCGLSREGEYLRDVNNEI